MKSLFAILLLALLFLTACQQAQTVKVPNALPNVPSDRTFIPSDKTFVPSDKVYEKPSQWENSNLPPRVLTDEQIKRAVKLGQESVTDTQKIFKMKEVGDVNIITPEINLAFTVANNELSPEEIERVARTDEVIFIVTLRGSYDGFQEVVNAAIYLEDGTLVRPVRVYRGDSRYYDSNEYDTAYYSSGIQGYFKYTALKGKRFTLKLTNEEPYHIDFTNEV